MGLLDSTTQQDYYQGNDHGNYQFTSLDDVINQFIVAYVGEDKIISRVKRVDVAFHAQRALQELSFDTFKSTKAQEITLPPSLQMILPQDYVNYTKISTVDSAGIKHLLYPTSKTSNPTIEPITNANNDYLLQAVGVVSSSSDQAVLTSEHKDIRIGMIMSGAHIDKLATVGGTSTSAGITTVYMVDLNGGPVFGTSLSQSTTTITFSNPDGSLVYPVESIHTIEGTTSGLVDFKITAASANDVVDIKVGMIVNDANYPVGTVVTNVHEAVISVSNNLVFTPLIIDNDGEITFISPNLLESTTWSNYKSQTPSENNNDDYEDDTYWPMNGERYGLDPQHAQANGSFYIDDQSGKIHFSSNVSGKTVILDYISDSLGTDPEMQVHKFAEEAMYKCIAYAILSTRANVQEYIVQRYKKERFAAIRTAKLRLSNIKLEEITQILRGKSKQIKH
jgi:hypothetical protein